MLVRPTIKRRTGLSGYCIGTFYRAYAEGATLLEVNATEMRGGGAGRISASIPSAAGLLRGDRPEPLPSTPRGERLCRAYKEFRSLVPDTEITMEHAMLLTELERGEQMELGRCSACQVLILIDRLAIAASQCAYCGHKVRAGLSVTYSAGTDGYRHEEDGRKYRPLEQRNDGIHRRASADDPTRPLVSFTVMSQEPCRTSADDAFEIRRQVVRNNLPDEYDCTHLCILLANTAYAAAKQYRDRGPVFAFFRLIRNARAHTNTFNFSAHEPKREPPLSRRSGLRDLKGNRESLLRPTLLGSLLLALSIFLHCCGTWSN